MGKKPFSAKAKREQLRQKRHTAATSTSPSTAAARTSSKQQQVVLVSAATTLAANSSPTTTAQSSNAASSGRYPRPREPRGGVTNSHRYRLQLSSSTDKQEVSSSTLSSTSIHTPIPKERKLVETCVDDIRPLNDIRFQFPKRPAWSHADTQSEIDVRETSFIHKWTKNMSNSKNAEETPAYFEHNVETWRQLWRVIERSDIIVLVADIRYPALHFVPDLYEYVTTELKGKAFLLALNKCDLVTNDVLNAWKHYFETRFPKLAVAMFSSFPDAKLKQSEHNSELLSKRERRMKRSKVAAWGAHQLLHAVLSLEGVHERKKQFLQEWRERIGDGSSSDDDINKHDDTIESIDVVGKEYVYGREEEYLERDGHRRRRKENKTKKKAALRKRQRSLLTSNPGNETKLIEEDDDDEDEEEESITRNNKLEKLKEDLNDRKYDGTSEDFITVGIVGHPNAGKSSLINGIFRKKVVSTSKTPGHTKHLQTMFLTDRVRLCDCPGLVFPGIAARELQIIAGMFPIAQVREPVKVVGYLAEYVNIVDVLGLDGELGKLRTFLLDSEYGKDGCWSAYMICEAWAMKRGYRTAKAARLDVGRAGNHILRMALDGRIVLATLPSGFLDEHHGGNGSEKPLALMDKEWMDNKERERVQGQGYGEAQSPGNEGSEEEVESTSSSSGDDDGDGGNQKVAVSNAFALLDDEDN